MGSWLHAHVSEMCFDYTVSFKGGPSVTMWDHWIEYLCVFAGGNT